MNAMAGKGGRPVQARAVDSFEAITEKLKK